MTADFLFFAAIFTALSLISPGNLSPGCEHRPIEQQKPQSLCSPEPLTSLEGF